MMIEYQWDYEKLKPIKNCFDAIHATTECSKKIRKIIRDNIRNKDEDFVGIMMKVFDDDFNLRMDGHVQGAALNELAQKLENLDN